MVGLVKVSLGQIGRRRRLGRTSLVGLGVRKVVVSELEIVGNLLPTFVVRVRRVRQVVVFVGRKVLVIGEGNVLIELLQEEMPVAAEELHLGYTLLLEREGVLVELVELLQRRVYT